MSNNVIQPSFSGGEFSPTLYARVDLAKYHVGAALLENFFVDFRGGASNRAGTGFVTRGRVDSSIIRLIPFIFSTVQTYVLEFGEQYMRVIKDGASVLETALAVSGISQAVQGRVTTTAPHGYSNGDWVYFSGLGGMTQLNGYTAKIENVTANTFDLLDLNGTPLSTLSFSAFTAGGTVARVYTITTPYAASDLQLLKYTQSADTMTLVHPSYAPRNLTRSAHANWTLSAISFASNIAAPTGVAAVASAAGVAVYAYVVTAVGADGQESVASARGDVNAAVNISVTAGHIDISWVAVTGAVSYNVYKASHLPTAGTIPVGVPFGFIGTATGTGFVDNNITPDFTFTPPLATNPFASSNNPGTVGYFQQRKVYAASNSNPETFWMSQPGAFNNFDVSNPVKADDAITGTLASLQVNAIKHMVAMPGGLVMLTSGSAFQVSGGGGANSPITPSSIVATAQAYNGCSDVPPLPINQNLLYVQSRGTIVRDMSYNFYTNIYTGADISLLSNHLFRGYVLKEWTWAEEPYKVVWAVRDDGQCLSLTYLKEQEVFGWAHHKTLGLFESVAAIQEGTENFVYFVVKRYIGGQWVRYIERMASRQFNYGPEDAWFVDCGLTNTLTYPAATLTASASSGSGVTFTASVAVFSAGDVGKVLRIGGGIATITAYTSPTVLVGTLTRDIENVLWEDPSAVPTPAASGAWSLDSKFTTFGGLWHLEGQTVKVLGDGSVFPDKVVSGGQITLEHAVSKVIVGLGYTAKLQTLYLDVGEPTVQGKRKKLPAITVRVAESRGMSVGPTFDDLIEIKQRTDEPMGQPIELITGDEYVRMPPLWGTEGQICVEQTYPLPATILGLIPEVVIGDTNDFDRTR